MIRESLGWWIAWAPYRPATAAISAGLPFSVLLIAMIFWPAPRARGGKAE
jgi:hypothetical protein